MIILVGHRASGKTTVSRIFSKNGYWVFDTGPFLRGFSGLIHENATPETLLASLRESTGNNKWDDEFIAIIAKYGYEQSQEQDLVIVGYRSYDDVVFLKLQLDKLLPSKLPIYVVYVDCKPQTAFERYKRREKSDFDFDRFLADREINSKRGLEKLKNNADFVLFNDIDTESLESRTTGLIKQIRIRE